MKKVFLLIAVAGMMLTSCKDCKDCTLKHELLNEAMEAEYQEDAEAAGYTTIEEYFNSDIGEIDTKYCDEDLKDVQSTYVLLIDSDGDNMADYRVSFDCK